MDKSQVLYKFWSGFGLPAYDPSTVDEKISLPYITYETSTGKIGEEFQTSNSIWYKSTSWEDISKKAEEIGDAIGIGGVTIPYDNGILWIRRSSPFAQRMPDDESIRRILLLTTLEFIEG